MNIPNKTIPSHFKKSKPTPPYASSSSFTSLTPSFCFCCTTTETSKPKKEKARLSDGLMWVLISNRDSSWTVCLPIHQFCPFFFFFWDLKKKIEKWNSLHIKTVFILISVVRLIQQLKKKIKWDKIYNIIKVWSCSWMMCVQITKNK